jgi:hypothetical protein
MPGEEDLLERLLAAWRQDIESVPFPEFEAVLLPRQRDRDSECSERPAPHVIRRH